jgi:uncharacterized membrane protein
MTNHTESVGIVGTITSAWMLIVSMLPHLTQTVQLLTALAGLVAAVCTAIYMARKLKNQKNEKPD